MSYCQQFKEKILGWKEEPNQARALLQEFMVSGDSNKIDILCKKLKEISDEQERIFENEFKLQAVEILKKWYSATDADEDEVDSFIEDLKFTKEGRIVIDGNLIIINQSIAYFPCLIKIIKGMALLGAKVSKKTISSGLQGLEVVGSELSLSGREFNACPNLRKIGDNLDIRGCPICDLEQFKKAFPKLQDIGKSIMGTSLYFSPDQNILKEQIELEAKKGGLALRFSGGIYIDTDWKS